MEIGTKSRMGSQVSDGQLRQFRLFNEVDLALIRPLIDKCTSIMLQSGDLLLSPERTNNTLYLLISGKVSVYLGDPVDVALLELGPGDCIGETSVLDGRKPSAYVRATENTEVLMIKRRQLWQLIDCSHSLSRNLLSMLASRIRSGNDLVSSSKINEELQHKAANSDALTGLFNRRWLDDMLGQLHGWELLNRLPLSVLMLDVDHFKAFNDEYGHKSGDLVLQMTAQSIQQCLRPEDAVARYGGEEFLVLLPRTPKEKALAIAERLRQCVGSRIITVDQGQALPPITISIGVAMVDRSCSLDDAIDGADKALFMAKNSGRNRIEWYGDED